MAITEPQHKFRLIPKPQSQADAVSAFVRLADAVQAREGRERIEALQMAADQFPAEYSAYLGAFRR
jgi:hypothetical protein